MAYLKRRKPVVPSDLRGVADRYQVQRTDDFQGGKGEWWHYEIRCFACSGKALIFPRDETTLGAYLTTRHVMRRMVAEMGAIVAVEVDDPGFYETIVEFPASKIAPAAKILKARKRRQVSEEERTRLAKMLRDNLTAADETPVVSAAEGQSSDSWP